MPAGWAALPAEHGAPGMGWSKGRCSLQQALPWLRQQGHSEALPVRGTWCSVVKAQAFECFGFFC